MGRNQEIEVAQNLRPEAVSQSDIFEPNQAQLRETIPETPVPGRSQQGFASVMVSDSLTVAL
jgi:hypothetical protein